MLLVSRGETLTAAAEETQLFGALCVSLQIMTATGKCIAQAMPVMGAKSLALNKKSARKRVFR